jgi:phosphoenolpyruvate synthase/pyruvate phosphate dikinase
MNVKNIFAVWLDDPSARDRSLVGGKAAALSRLLAGQYDVPRGFVVTSAARTRFLEVNELRDAIIQTNDSASTSRAVPEAGASAVAQKLRRAILAGHMPTEVSSEISVHAAGFMVGQRFAVRSSGVLEDGASQSWAGQFDSFLDVAAEDIEEYVMRCWASQFGSRALSYGLSRPQGGEGRGGLAVLVQEYVEGQTSGVSFSVEPVTEDRSKILIEAVPGDGTSLVSGRAVPFSAIIDKDEGIVLRRQFAGDLRTELLAPHSLREIAMVTKSIETFFGCPIDIEWTREKGKLWILQARPITGLTMEEKPDRTSLPDILKYQLTFKVTGLGFLFTDMLMRGFGYLNPLFTSNKQAFRQYFPDERMEFAAREGYKWLSSPGGFESYRTEFRAFHESAVNRAEQILSTGINPINFGELLNLLARHLEFYSKTDFQFTNLTYLYYNEDAVVRHSLDELAKFKESARVWINDAVIEETSYFARLITMTANQLSLSSNDLEAYKIVEVISAFDGYRVPQAEISERKTAFVVYKNDEMVRYIVGDTAQQYIEAVAEIEDRLASSSVIGQVANKTTDSVTGVVRNIMVDYANLDKMEREMEDMLEGEILVSEFTAPELMTACRKAKAIVTDLGGMLSHAAIVSRELGIPCVVGTRTASRAYRTGDRISVDLRTGAIEHQKNPGQQ